MKKKRAHPSCQIIFKKEIQAARDTRLEEQKQVKEYTDKFATPYVAAAKGYIDSVIFPEETRSVLMKGLESCLNKRVNAPKRKHGNIPL